MPALNTNTEGWVNPQKSNGEARFLRHLLFGSDLDSTNLNPRFKYPIRLQPVASNTTDLLTLDEDYNGRAFVIDSEATTVDVIDISPATLTTGNVIDISDADLLTTGRILNMVSNAPSTSTRTLVQLTNDHTSATGVTIFGVLQDSTGDSLFIDHNGITGKAVFIDHEGTTQTDGVVDISAAVLTTGTVVDIGDADLLTSGKILNLVSNAPSGTARTLVQITNDHTSATAAVGLTITNDSTSDEAQFISNAAGAVGAKVNFRHISASPANDDVIGRLLFNSNDNSATERQTGKVDVLWTSVVSGSYSSRFIFYTSNAAAENEAMRLLAPGTLQLDLASEIAGTTGVADVFDDHDDLMIISKWRKDPVLRQEFVNHLEGMGIVERKNSGSGYLLNMQANAKLTWGAFNQMGDIMRDQQDQIDAQHDEIGELRESIGQIVAANAVHGMPNQLGA